MIDIVAGLLETRERLEFVFSDDHNDHLGADAVFFHRLWDLGDDFELVNDGSFSQWTAKASTMCEYAAVYGGAYDITLKVCKCHVQRDLKLPEPLRFFCVDVMEGKLKRPKHRVLGKGRERHWQRNEIFIRYMKFLTEECGYHPQSNPTNNNSAADILAAAFGKCGYHMITYDTIMNVWKDKVFREELDALFRR